VAALPLKLHATPDPDAIRVDVRFHVAGRLADEGQVDAEQLGAPIEWVSPVLKMARAGCGEPGQARIGEPPPNTTPSQSSWSAAAFFSRRLIECGARQPIAEEACRGAMR